MRYRQILRTACVAVLAAQMTGGASACARVRPATVRAPSSRLVRAARAKVTRAQLASLVFEPNVGQVRGAGSRRVQFVARGQGYTLFLSSTGVVMRFQSRIQDAGVRSQQQARRLPISGNAPELGGESRVASGKARNSEVVRLQFEGANPRVRAVGLNELAGKANYFTGRNPARWQKNVATYARVKLENVYPGVDAVFYVRRGQLEYDFIVAPGADPRAIKLAIETGNSKRERRKSKLESAAPGSKRGPSIASSGGVRVAASGDLVIPTGAGTLRLKRPVVYQKESGVRKQDSQDMRADTNGGDLQTSIGNRQLLQGRYVLAANNQIRFEVSGYDKTRPLVIDPVLSYSTYLGGSGYDAAAAIAVDSAGNAYITGQTDSLDFPTSNAMQPAPGGGTCGGTLDAVPCFDVFVTKLAASGSSVAYSTYLGGSGDDRGTGIAVDSAGNVYVTGDTASSDFPILKSWQPAYRGGYCGSATDPAPCFDGFVTKLNTTGAALVYSTYLGGSAQDLASGIALDSAGEATVAGSTSSADFPTTAGVFQGAYAGGTLDAFVVRLSADGSKAVYSTLLGGADGDRGLGVAVDSAGNTYVTGSTASGDFPVSYAIQSENAGGTCGSTASPTPCTDAFVARLNASGTALDYSTYLGGSGGDAGNAIAVDAAGAAYVAGMTASGGFPVTPGAFQPSGGGVSIDAFVSKLSPDGSALAYSTYLGGIGQEAAYGLAVDSAGQAYVTGYANDAAFPVVSPVEASSGGFYDAFVTKLNAAGSDLIFSTCLGGSGNEAGRGIAMDGAGNAYVAGETFSVDLPTASALEPAYGGGAFDAFAAKFSGLKLPVVKLGKTSVVFADQGVGTTSEPIAVSVTNEGDAALEITGIVMSGDFSETNDCGSNLPPGADCTLQITSTPADYGPRIGSVTFNDNAWGSPQVIRLAGNGIPSPVVGLSPDRVDFAGQTVGTISAARSVALSNAGSTTLDISAISTLGDFSQTDNCGTSVEAGGNCSIAITFSPQTAGGLAGQVTIEDDAPGSPHVVTLTGTGLGPAASLSSGGIAFGNQGMETTSVPRSVTLTNSGTMTLNISSLAASGDFAETNNCGVSLASGASCTIQVTFAPTALGNRTGALTIADDAPDSPQTIPLEGDGVVAFSLSSSPSQTTVVMGTDKASFTVRVSTAFSYSSPVALACDGNPSIQCSFNPPAIYPGDTSSLTVGNLSQAASDSVSFDIQGASGGQTSQLPLAVLISDFSLKSLTPTATVSAGQAATFQMAVESVNGFNQPITLDCSGVPSGGTCSVGPTEVTPSGAGPVSVTLTVQTSGQALSGMGLLLPGNNAPFAGWKATALMFIVMGLLMAFRSAFKKPRLPRLTAASLGIYLLLLAGCGGGGGQGTTGTKPAPPTGRYEVKVTGTSGQLVRSVTVRLQVN